MRIKHLVVSVIALAVSTPGTASPTSTTVFAWGDGHQGKLGYDHGAISSTVVNPMSDSDEVVAFDGGDHFSVLLRTDGSVWVVGSAAYGVFGQGTTHFAGSFTPLKVPGLAPVKAIAAGWTHVLAVTHDGSIWAWGDNGTGQLGNGAPSWENACWCEESPVQVEGIDDAVAVAAGRFVSYALRADGTVWAWGTGGYGQLGHGSSGVASFVPVQVSLPGKTIAISTRLWHALALQADGTVWAWGFNSFGELGIGNSPFGCQCEPTPAKVLGLTDVASIAAGAASSVAAREDGSVFAWGFNRYGAVGVGDTTDRHTPVAVPSVGGIVSLSASYHVLARTSAGEVWTWGRSEYGQLGDGTSPQTGCRCETTPAKVAGLDRVTVVGVGTLHSLALRPRDVTNLVADPVIAGAAPPTMTLRAVLTLASTGEGLNGSPVRFSAGATVLCAAAMTAGTGTEAGTATCGLTTAQQLAVIVNGGYTAAFSGTPLLAPIQAQGTLV